MKLNKVIWRIVPSAARLTYIGYLLRPGFNGAARCCLALSKVVGYTYTKAWSLLGISWFDHNFDHLLGPDYNCWAERGVLGNRLIKPGDIVLDIACGDGFYDANYYASKASSIDAFDRDRRAIRTAKAKHSRPNINFFVEDALRISLSPSSYDVIFLFAAIEHFSERDGSFLLDRICPSLKPTGVLLGSTPIFSERGGHNEEHDNEFLSVEQLCCFLEPHFSRVELWCSPWPKGRIDCYFWAWPK